MYLEAKKKLLASAISDVKGLADALSAGPGSTQENPVIRLKATKTALKVASVYAEATVPDATIKEEGEAILDLQSFLQALSVSGDVFKIRLEDGDKSAFFWCGRAKGPISLRDSGFHEQVLADAPKPDIHIVGFKELLSSLAMKGADGATDRTLHFDPKGTVRGESSDGYRATAVVAKTDSDKTYKASALSLDQKSCDQLAKLVGESKIGFNDNFLSVVSPGLKAVVPLSANPPLEIKAQLASFLPTLKNYGTFTVKVAELKGALSDAIGMIGKHLQARLDLEVSATETAAKFAGESEAGDIEAEFQIEETALKVDVSMSLLASYLREVLDFYKQDLIKVTVYDSAIAIDLVESGAQIESQTTVVPLMSPIQDALPDSGDEEDESPKPKKAAKKASKKPEPEEEDEDEDEEDEPAPAPAPKKKAATKKAA